MNNISSSALFVAISIYLLLGINNVESHSWLHCTDYDGTITGLNFDESLCNGYTRNWKSYSGQGGLTTFGAGDQLAYVGGDGNWCQHDITSPLSDSYDDTYPYATYYLGETITLVWPAKNHATHEDCPRTSPDSEMVLYYNPDANPSSDPISMSADWEVYIDWHAEDGTSDSDFAIAGRPFSNCPGFCDDSDKTPCTGQFEITADKFSESGMYTFMWYWSGSGAYSMCYEAYVNIDESVTTGDDDDTTTGDDDDDDGDDDDDDDDDDSIDYYDIRVTVCYEGDTYNQDNIDNAVDSLFSDWDWSVTTYHNKIVDNEFNVTIKVITTLEDQNTIVEAMSDGTLCDAILNEYDDSTDTCSIDCSLGIYINIDEEYGVSNNNNSDDDFTALYIVVAVAIIVIIMIVALIVYSKKEDKRKATNAKEANHGHVINSTANTQKNIVSTND